MTTTPTYDALIAEQKFDPASVTICNRAERKIQHERWLHTALAKVAAADLTKPKRRPRKAS